MTDFVGLIKQAALDAVEGEKPVSVLFGTVTGTSPLQIRVEQRLTLREKMLVLPRHLCAREETLSLGGETDVAEGHSHSMTGARTALIHGGLSVGDRVLLLRVQGGQRFVVLDRLAE